MFSRCSEAETAPQQHRTAHPPNSRLLTRDVESVSPNTKMHAVKTARFGFMKNLGCKIKPKASSASSIIGLVLHRVQPAATTARARLNRQKGTGAASLPPTHRQACSAFPSA